MSKRKKTTKSRWWVEKTKTVRWEQTLLAPMMMQVSDCQLPMVKDFDVSNVDIYVF